jgi:parallel beta-helix repeat protein
MASGDGSVGFYLWSSSTNSLSKNTANSNYHAGFDLNHSSNNNKLNLNIANMNSGYGYIDTSSGSGTRGTTNFYASDECSSNGAGGSHPSELGTPQP